MNWTRVARRSDWAHLPATAGSIVVVALVTLVLYGTTLNDFFLSDDFDLLMRASREPLGWWLFWPDPARSGWFRPVPEALWRINYLAAGLDPFAFRATNLVLHALNGCVVAAIARRTTGSAVGGVVAGLLFAAWPRATGAVSWLSGRYDLVATGFVLLTVMFAMRAAERQGRLARIPVIAGTLLALASKEVAVVLPALLAALASRRLTRASGIDTVLVRWTDAAAVTVVVSLYLAVRLIVFGGLGGYGIHGQISTGALMRPFLLLPGFLPVDRLVVAPDTAAWMVLAAIIVAVLAFLAPVWLLWMLLSMLPAANLIDLHVPMYEFDRFFYLASAGLAFAVGAIVVRLTRTPTAPRLLLTTAMIVAVLSISVISTKNLNARWDRAAALARRVDTTVRDVRAQLRAGDAIDCSALPDNIGGAYAYRNGCDAQIRLALGGDDVRGIRVVPGVPPDPITARRESFARIWVLSADGRRLTLPNGR